MPSDHPEPPLTPATAHRFLLEHDRNRDGRLTLDELPELLRRRFARADLDGNGELDPREILVGPNRISREARRAEGLRLTRRGLETKAGPIVRGDSVEFRVPSTILQRLDHNKDGFADTRELGTILREPDVLFGDRPYSMTAEEARALAARLDAGLDASSLSAETSRAATPPAVGSAFDPSLLEHAPRLPARPDEADITTQHDSIPRIDEARPTASPAVDEATPVAQNGTGPDAMPDAQTILQHLDKNGNGQLDRGEAVDQLADNFDKLDRNHDNMLSDKEIKRGLFLARMLGIKPKQDPRTYRSHKPADGSSTDEPGEPEDADHPNPSNDSTPAP
jgi:hypothetical protein